MRVIAVANQKGGCGKTTTAINLSSCLALKGQKVLLIDFDPQSHATMGLNIECSPDRNMYHVMAPVRTGAVRLDDVIVSVKEDFDIAPSDMLLCAVEQELAGEEGREKRLLEAIECLQQPYDFIIIDCPPSIGHLCFNALRASSEAIIPIDMSLFSLRGIAKLTDMMCTRDNVRHEDALFSGSAEESSGEIRGEGFQYGRPLQCPAQRNGGSRSAYRGFR